jgi:hypothetical protein
LGARQSPTGGGTLFSPEVYREQEGENEMTHYDTGTAAAVELLRRELASRQGNHYAEALPPRFIREPAEDCHGCAEARSILLAIVALTGEDEERVLRISKTMAGLA